MIDFTQRKSPPLESPAPSQCPLECWHPYRHGEKPAHPQPALVYGTFKHKKIYGQHRMSSQTFYSRWLAAKINNDSRKQSTPEAPVPPPVPRWSPSPPRGPPLTHPLTQKNFTSGRVQKINNDYVIKHVLTHLTHGRTNPRKKTPTEVQIHRHSSWHFQAQENIWHFLAQNVLESAT